ncbi:hypothetical protein [Celeribacter sp.]|uniref:hypothetical protein n=1 Tax=Celeribacter sp. TaxID=1890673 RepID=UPI003A8FD0EA
MKTTKFTAGLIAFSLAISAAAAPARADDKGVATALGGLLALIVIGKAIEGSSKPAPAPVYNAPHNNGKGHKASPFDIPQVCVVTLDRRGAADSNIALKSCLQNKSNVKTPLPQRCEVDVRSNRRTLDAYDVSCLSRFGYQVADRRH